MSEPVVVINGVVLDGSSQPIVGSRVRMRTIAPLMTLQGNAITTQDIETLTGAGGTWSITQIAGLAGQVDIPDVGILADFQLPSTPGTINFSSLTLFARGTLTPATILSNHGPSMGGDLLGQSPQPQVIGFRGVQLAVGTPTNGQAYVYDNATSKFTLQSVTTNVPVVTVVSAGAGITVTGTATNPIVSVTAGGITSTQLDSGTNALINGALQRSGGVMTGALTLAANSASALQATTQQEVTAGLATKLGVAQAIPESQVTNLVTDLSATEKTVNKGASLGYAPLDASSKVPFANLPATFPPAAHASTHAIAGSDVLTPAAIGAANLVHTHAEGDVTSLIADLASKGGLTSPNTWTQLQTFNGGISVPGGFSPGGSLTVQPTFDLQILMAAPAAPSLTPSASGGTLASGTYFYVITSLDGVGETVRGIEASTPVTGPNGSVLLNWTAIPGAASYRVYRGTSAGAENVWYAAGTNSLTDTGSAGTGGTPPVSGTAYTVRFDPIGSSWILGGNVGIKKSTPGTALDVNGTATATLFSGPLTGAVTGNVVGNLTGNVTGNVTGTAGSLSAILTTALGGLGINAGASTGFPKFTAGSVAIAALVAGDIPVLDTSKITTGLMALARGGTNADLSGTGGASQVLRQSAPGAAVTVSQLAYTDISGTPASLPPSGAASGDLAGSYPSPTTAKLNTATVPAAGALTTGNVLQVTGASALSYAAINLAGGANFVTGILPAANVATIPFSQVSGIVPVNQGGSGANLGATGGANQIVRQNSVGGAFTVSALASGDIPNNAANTSGSAATFTGSLAGDVTGTQAATVVALVGTSSAANVHAAELLANAATSTNAINTIVKRDGSGNFTAGTITAALSGNATTASDGLTSAAGTAPLTLSLAAKALTGSVADMVGATGIAAGVHGLVPQPQAGDNVKVLSGAGTWVVNGAGSVTSVGLAMPADFSVANTPVTSSAVLTVTRTTQSANTVLAGPVSGGAATPAYRALVSADIPNNAANTSGTAASFTGSLVGDVTGTQGATVIALVGGSTAANVNTATVAVNTNATSAATASTLVKRDGSAGFAANIITATQNVISNAGAAIDLVSAGGAGTPAIRLRDTTSVTGAGVRLIQNGFISSLNSYNLADSLQGTIATFGTATGQLVTTTPLWDKGGAVYNVLAYGADPSGVADSTSAINAAITASVSGGLGGTVFFPRGTYQFSTLSITNANVVLQGTGATSILTTNTTAVTAITIGANNVKIQDLAITVTGTSAAGNILVSLTSSNTIIRNCNFSRFMVGIALAGAVACFIEDTRFTPQLNWDASIRLSGVTASNTFINVFCSSNGGTTGMALDINANPSSNSNNTFLNCYFTGTGTSAGNYALWMRTQAANANNTNTFTTCFFSTTSATANTIQLDGEAGLIATPNRFIGCSLGDVVQTRVSVDYISSAFNNFTYNSTLGVARLMACTGLTLTLGAASKNIQVTGGYWSNPLVINTGATFYSFYNVNGFNSAVGPVIASASTIAPSAVVTHVTGTTPIVTITPPAFTAPITLIPDGAWSWTTAGNIAVAGGATVGIPVVFTFDDATGKWYPGNPAATPAFTTGSIAFAGASGALTQDNANLFWDDTNNRLGIAMGAGATGTGFAVPLTINGVVDIHSFTASPSLRLRSSNGVLGTPSATLNNDTLGQFNAFGYGTTAYSGTGRAIVKMQAGENWSDTAQGSFMTFSTTANTTVVTSEQMRVTGAGNVGIGTTAPATKLDVNGTANALTQQVTAATNGATMTFGSSTELVTLSTVAAFTDTAGNLLPANAIIDGVTALVTTSITIAATWSLGDPTTSARFSALAANQTAGLSVSGRAHWSGAVTTAAAGPTQDTAAKVRITSNVTPGAGVIRVTVFWHTLNPPTS